MGDKDRLQITEQRNSNTSDLDKLDAEAIIRTINEEDKTVVEAVSLAIDSIAELVEAILPRFKTGGRLIYVGAGTSGRLGIIDAVECVPTFSIEPGQVIGLLAGGQEAMFTAIEGREDDEDAGREELAQYEITELDSVIGIAASGETPYVIGALKEANSAGALTAALVCNHNTRLKSLADYAVEVIVGPEVLTGSTRMKAGTAQKMVLNMISTTLMIKLGKVYSNLMVDLNVSNQKLQERALNIFQEIIDITDEEARDYLERSDYNLKLAIVMEQKDCSKKAAEYLLLAADGRLGEIIDRSEEV